MNRKIAIRSTIAALAAGSMLLAGCDTMSPTQKGTAAGAGIGAVGEQHGAGREGCDGRTNGNFSVHDVSFKTGEVRPDDHFVRAA